MFLSRLGLAAAAGTRGAGPSFLSASARLLSPASLSSPRGISTSAISRALTRSTRTATAPAALGLGLSRGLGLRFASHVTARRSPKAQLTGQQWPWHVVENPPPGTEEIERVVFARGNKALGKTFWAMAIVFTFGLVNWALIPSPNEAIRKGVTPEEERTVMGMPLETFFTWATGGWVAVCGAIAIGGLFMMSRFVSRLSLVQQKAVGAPPASARKFLRMSTAVQGALPFWRTPREIPVAAAHVELLRGRKTLKGGREINPYLKLDIRDPKASLGLRMLDRSATYRLDFSENDLSKEGEMVLSMQRLEDVFGRLEYSQGR